MMKICCPLIVLFLLVTSGCGDGGAAVLKRRSDLERLAGSYREYHKLHQRAPADASQLLDFMRAADDQAKETISAAAALQEGDILMIWNGDLDTDPEPGRFVLGFEAGVPAHGGYVVMGDGTVKVIKRGQFQSAVMLPTGVDSVIDRFGPQEF